MREGVGEMQAQSGRSVCFGEGGGRVSCLSLVGDDRVNIGK